MSNVVAEIRKILTRHYQGITLVEAARAMAYAPGIGFSVRTPPTFKDTHKLPKAALVERFINRGASSCDTDRAIETFVCNNMDPRNVKSAHLVTDPSALLHLVQGVAGNTDAMEAACKAGVSAALFEITKLAFSEMLDMVAGPDLGLRTKIRGDVARGNDQVTAASLADAVLGEWVAYQAGIVQPEGLEQLTCPEPPDGDQPDEKEIAEWARETLGLSTGLPLPCAMIGDYAPPLFVGRAWSLSNILYSLTKELHDEQNLAARLTLMGPMAKAFSSAAALCEQSYVLWWPVYTTSGYNVMTAMRLLHEKATYFIAGMWHGGTLVVAPADCTQPWGTSEMVFSAFGGLVADDGIIRRTVAPRPTEEQARRYREGTDLMKQAVMNEIQGAAREDVGLPPSTWWTGAVRMGHEATARAHMKKVFTEGSIEDTPLAFRDYVKERHG